MGPARIIQGRKMMQAAGSGKWAALPCPLEEVSPAYFGLGFRLRLMAAQEQRRDSGEGPRGVA